MAANTSLAAQVASLPEDEREKVLAGIDPQELLWDWSFWGRPAQLVPEGDWKTWLIMAGRGFGKSRAGSEFIRAMVCGPTPEAPGQYRRIGLIGETARDVRKVMVEGESGILGVHPPAFRPEWQPSTRTLLWPNGAEAATYNATEPEELRGPQFDLLWMDEIAKWRHAVETFDQAQFALRLGENPRQIATTTPRPVEIVRRLVDDKATIITRGSTNDNRANLAPSFLSYVEDQYGGSRLGRQELDGELIEDVEGALWSRAVIDRDRVREGVEMERIVVAVDPSGSSGAGSNSDDIGIIVAGLGVDGRWYVIADWSINGSPDTWAKRVVSAFHHFQADRVVAEANYGGAMVEAVIRSADASIPYKAVHASRGKTARAEPIAALYEQGKVSHIGCLPDLEDQLCGMVSGGEYLGPGRSPDRADALVWALTELQGRSSSGPSLRRL